MEHSCMNCSFVYLVSCFGAIFLTLFWGVLMSYLLLVVSTLFFAALC